MVVHFPDVFGRNAEAWAELVVGIVPIRDDRVQAIVPAREFNDDKNRVQNGLVIVVAWAASAQAVRVGDTNGSLGTQAEGPDSPYRQARRVSRRVRRRFKKDDDIKRIPFIL